MKKQGYLLLVLLMSAFVFCSCGQKDTKEVQDQTEETAKDTKEDSKTKETKDTKKENKTADEENTEQPEPTGGVPKARDAKVMEEPAEETKEESAAQPEQAKHLVVIDPGHQSKGDSSKEPIGPGASEMKAKVAGGTSGVTSGLAEYELTLQVSLKLRTELQNRGYEVQMTRESNDVNISNSERAAVANNANAEAFVRIHANGSTDSSVSGAMTICQTASNPYNAALYEKSKALSTAVLTGKCDRCKKGICLGNRYHERDQLGKRSGYDRRDGVYDKPDRGQQYGIRCIPEPDRNGDCQWDRCLFCRTVRKNF